MCYKTGHIICFLQAVSNDSETRKNMVLYSMKEQVTAIGKESARIYGE